MKTVFYQGQLPPHIINIAKENQIILLEKNNADEPFLSMNEGRLGLITSEMIKNREKPIYIDMEKMLAYHAKQKYSLNHELFAKALGKSELKKKIVFDLTCGMAQDFSLMLSFGVKKIIAFEREALIYLMLYDAFEKSGLNQESREHQLIMGDFVEEDKWDSLRGDILYFDPMFEEAKKKKSLPKKEMRIFQKLFSTNNQNIFIKFKNSSFKKLIIKRPSGGSFYFDQKPTHSHEGKTVRYDTYLK